MCNAIITLFGTLLYSVWKTLFSPAAPHTIPQVYYDWFSVVWSSEALTMARTSICIPGQCSHLSYHHIIGVLSLFSDCKRVCTLIAQRHSGQTWCSWWHSACRSCFAHPLNNSMSKTVCTRSLARILSRKRRELNSDPSGTPDTRSRAAGRASVVNFN